MPLDGDGDHTISSVFRDRNSYRVIWLAYWREGRFEALAGLQLNQTGSIKIGGRGEVDRWKAVKFSSGSHGGWIRVHQLVGLNLVLSRAKLSEPELAAGVRSHGRIRHPMQLSILHLVREDLYGYAGCSFR